MDTTSPRLRAVTEIIYTAFSPFSVNCCGSYVIPSESWLLFYPSGEPGVSGDFWGSQEGCQGPFRPSGRNRGLPFRRRRGQGPHLATLQSRVGQLSEPLLQWVVGSRQVGGDPGQCWPHAEHLSVRRSCCHAPAGTPGAPMLGGSQRSYHRYITLSAQGHPHPHSRPVPGPSAL